MRNPNPQNRAVRLRNRKMANAIYKNNLRCTRELGVAPKYMHSVARHKTKITQADWGRRASAWKQNNPLEI